MLGSYRGDASFDNIIVTDEPEILTKGQNTPFYTLLMGPSLLLFVSIKKTLKKRN